MTPTPPPPTTGAVSEGPRFAEVLAEHWNYDLNATSDAWECECGEVLDFRTGADLDGAQRTHLAAALHAELARWLGDEGVRERVGASQTAAELWRVFLRLPHTPSPLGDYVQRRVAHFRTLAALTAPTAEGSGR